MMDGVWSRKADADEIVEERVCAVEGDRAEALVGRESRHRTSSIAHRRPPAPDTGRINETIRLAVPLITR